MANSFLAEADRKRDERTTRLSHAAPDRIAVSARRKHSPSVISAAIVRQSPKYPSPGGLQLRGVNECFGGRSSRQLGMMGERLDVSAASQAKDPAMLDPIFVVALGIVFVIVLIGFARLNAFLALFISAVAVSLAAPGDWELKIARVGQAFGTTAGKIGIVIALAAVIGKCLMDSGAADRIVRTCLRLIGENRAPVALMTSGFVLSIPVFFDTVFYLLVPLARSLYRQTRKRYVQSILVIAGGAAITHTLVPPTPGPLVIAETLGVDVGKLIVAGILVGIPAAAVGLLSAYLLDRAHPLPMRPYPGEQEMPVPRDSDLPPFWVAILPVLLPVVLISSNTVVQMIAKSQAVPQVPAQVLAMLGDPNAALLLSALVAMATLKWKRGLSLVELGKRCEEALMSGGVIILITSAGGAFGAMLQQTGISDRVPALLSLESQEIGGLWLFAAFLIAAVMKTAQGSSTVAMITTSAMIASLFPPGELASHIHCDPAYLALSIGAGSLVFCWMNDSGFWVVARMSGLSDMEALRLWTVQAAVVGIAAFITTLVAATVLPVL
ncbi:MAG: GntP family permease [Thermogutta sp.]